MKKMVLAMIVMASSAAYAQDNGLKPGLWVITPVSEIVDGHDISSQVSFVQANLQQAMANLSPAQRAQVQAMMGKAVTADASGIRICVSPAMAARGKPMVDPQGRCEPGTVTRTGNKVDFAFNCSKDGRTMVGKGVSTIGNDMLSTHLDMTTTDAQSSHTIQSESQMKFLGADCQGIKPLDTLAKKTPGAT